MNPKHKRFFNMLLDMAEEFEAEFGVNELGAPIVKILEQSSNNADTEHWYDINAELDNLLAERD